MDHYWLAFVPFLGRRRGYIILLRLSDLVNIKIAP